MGEIKSKINSIKRVQDTEEVIASSGRYDLQEYLRVIETFLEDEERTLRSLDDHLEDEAKRVMPNEPEAFKEYRQYEYYQYGIGFPRLLHNSFVVTVVSLLELELGIICRNLKEAQNIPIGWREIKGDTLEQAKRYLKIAGINLTIRQENWHEINNIYLVRNCIVHSNGAIRGSRDERALEAYAKHKSIISQDTERDLDLTRLYCEEVIKITEDFTDELWERVFKLRPIMRRKV